MVGVWQAGDPEDFVSPEEGMWRYQEHWINEFGIQTKVVENQDTSHFLIFLFIFQENSSSNYVQIGYMGGNFSEISLIESLSGGIFRIWDMSFSFKKSIFILDGEKCDVKLIASQVTCFLFTETFRIFFLSLEFSTLIWLLLSVNFFFLSIPTQCGLGQDTLVTLLSSPMRNVSLFSIGFFHSTPLSLSSSSNFKWMNV